MFVDISEELSNKLLDTHTDQCVESTKSEYIIFLSSM